MWAKVCLKDTCGRFRSLQLLSLFSKLAKSKEADDDMKTLRQIGAWLYTWWMKFARLLALINTRVILTLVYLFIIGPLAVVMRLLGKDVLDRKIEQSQSYWRTKEKVEHTLESARHQF